MTIRPIVVDINHADGSVDGKDRIDFVKVAKARFTMGGDEYRVCGIIHKASEGENFVDPLYKERKPQALAAGLLWGAYHFMRPGDVGNQVSRFYNVASAADTLYALDYEDEKLGLWQADHWLGIIRLTSGQVPWLYGGGVLKDQLQGNARPSLAQYPLWLSEYGPIAKVPEPWKKYTLWQRSGDGIGPGIHDIPGIGKKQDINYFDGSDDELREIWLDKGAGPIGVA